MDEGYFPGRPAETVTFSSFVQRHAGKDIGNAKWSFHRYVMGLMRAHSGTANKFVTNNLGFGYKHYYLLITKDYLSAVTVDAIRQLLNVDVSVFMSNYYPPILQKNVS